jgi:hypothetical protein
MTTMAKTEEKGVPVPPPELTDEQKIRAGHRIEQFLSDEEVQAGFTRLHADYYKAFRAAKTPEEREQAWAKARALDDLATELVASVQRGKVATATSGKRS